MREDKQATATRRLVMDSELTVYRAQETKHLLLDTLADCADLELDLSQVAEIDSAGFQLLVMLKREASGAGKTVRLIAHSPSVMEVLDFYNAAAFFGDPLHIPASVSA